MKYVETIGNILTLKRLLLIGILVNVLIFFNLFQNERRYNLYNNTMVTSSYKDQRDSNKSKQEQYSLEKKRPLHAAHQHLTEVDRGNEQLNQQISQNDTKIILWYQRARHVNPIPTPIKLNNCPYRCSLTTNKDFHAVSSALLFFAVLVPGKPPKRYDKQVFILQNYEPQCTFTQNYAIFKDTWKNVINWTMWYREDSDIYEPYGLIVNRTKVPEKNFTDIFNKKTKMAAAMVSNCDGQSKRMQYIRKLKALGVKIDVFGACGDHKCKRGKDDECRDEIQKNYKFFLSFESSLCPDYITEKFFVPYRGDIINVARGGGNYSKVAPKGTYINTQDFKNIKDVADYIIRLSKSKDEYIDILNRKNKYESLYEPFPHIDKHGHTVFVTYLYDEKIMCNLCRRLWNVEKYHKTYSDIKSWFDKSKCLPVNDIV